MPKAPSHCNSSRSPDRLLQYGDGTGGRQDRRPPFIVRAASPIDMPSDLRAALLSSDIRFPASDLRSILQPPMPALPSDLFALLDRLGIAHATVTHPALFTVEQSRALRGTISGGHTKNLFLKDRKDALFLVTALEDASIELRSLHRLLDASGRLSFGSAELLRAALGVEPGAVTPFAAMNDQNLRVSVVLDRALMRFETLNCHPLVNTMTTSIARADLLRFLEATGHPPRIVPLAEQKAPPEH
jgi:Ala-tRNA(Pro) deacylase